MTGCACNAISEAEEGLRQSAILRKRRGQFCGSEGLSNRVREKKQADMGAEQRSGKKKGVEGSKGLGEIKKRG